MDHEEFLGNNLEKIVLEKAGILKLRSKAIIAKQEKVALQILKRRTKALDCPTIIQNEDFQVEESNSSLLFSDSKKVIPLPKPKLEGPHQIANAGVAISALLELGCSQKCLNDAMQKVYWPGRLQRISQGNLSPSNLGFEAELFLDGGHNSSAGNAIADWIKQLKPSTFFLILGMMQNKDLEGFLKPLKSSIYKLIAVKIPEEINAREPENIVETSTKLHIPSKSANSIEHALNDVKIEDSILPKRILITGSLYLVGKYLKLNSS